MCTHKLLNYYFAKEISSGCEGFGIFVFVLVLTCKNEYLEVNFHQVNHTPTESDK